MAFNRNRNNLLRNNHRTAAFTAVGRAVAAFGKPRRGGSCRNCRIDHNVGMVIGILGNLNCVKVCLHPAFSIRKKLSAFAANPVSSVALVNAGGRFSFYCGKHMLTG